MAISSGLIAIILSIVIDIFNAPAGAAGETAIPNWAENVLVAIGTGALLKLGDALGALVQLSSGRHMEKLSGQLAASSPTKPVAASDPLPVRVEQPADEPVPVKEK